MDPIVTCLCALSNPNPYNPNPDPNPNSTLTLTLNPDPTLHPRCLCALYMLYGTFALLQANLTRTLP